MTVQHKPILGRRQSGFTIVELLIVIVVIAILATLVLITYSGIQNRAHSSAAQSDARNAAEKMAADNVSNGGYATSASGVDSGKGLPASPGTSYQYHSTGSTYCITATNGTVSYKISDTAPNPTAGGCAGDTVGGVPQITNLITNPRLATNSNGYAVTSPASTSSWSPTGGPVSGGTFTATTTTAGMLYMPFTSTISVQPNQPYAISFYLNSSISSSSAGISVTFDLNNGGSMATSMPIYPSTGWNRYNAVFTAPSNAVDISVAQLSINSVPSGSTFSLANAMITQSGSVPSYGDGSSPNWSWSGTPDASTSYGPSQ